MITEADIVAMAATVQTTPADPVIVQQWARTTQATMQRAEQQLMAEFSMWKFVRDDKRLMKVTEDLAHVRACLVYLATMVQE